MAHEVAILQRLAQSGYVMRLIDSLPATQLTFNDQQNEDVKDAMVLEWARHGDLLDYVVSFPNFPSERLCKRIFLIVLDGLEDLYGRNIAHRDVKFQNILVDSDFNLKLADFGHSTEFIPGEKLKKGRYGT